MNKNILALSFLFIPASTVQAQTNNDTISDQHLNNVDVVGKKCVPDIVSTSPLHTISHKEFEQMGMTDISSALKRLPGVTLRDYGGAGGMKTVSVRGFGSKHTGVSYDGIMLSECQNNEIDLSRYSLDNVESIQLLTGDNEDIFIPARNASSAALLTIKTLELKANDHLPHLTLQCKAGSFGFVSPFIRYEQHPTDKIAFSVAGEFTHADNNYPFTLHNIKLVTHEHRKNSKMNSGHAEINTIAKIGSNSTLSGKVYYYDNSRQLPGQVHYYTSISHERLHEQNAFTQVHFNTHNSHNLSLRLDGKFNWASSLYKNGNIIGGVSSTNYWQREAYTSACLLYTPARTWAISYAADYNFNNLNSNLITDTRPYRHTFTHSAAARMRLNRLTATARLIHCIVNNGAKDGEHANDADRLSPSVALSYKLLPNDDLFIRASYKHIFRAPTFNENYFFHYGSTSLAPENTDQVNAGLTWRNRTGSPLALELTADAYISSVDDKIVAVPYNMFVWTCINVAKVKSHGIDLSANTSYRLSASRQFLLTANYSYQRVENRSNSESPLYGYQIAYTPESTGSVAVAYENPLVNIAVHTSGMSKRYANNQHYNGTDIAGFMELGASVSKSFRFSKYLLSGRIDVNNILNKQYEYVRLYPMPGISIMGSITLKIL